MTDRLFSDDPLDAEHIHEDTLERAAYAKYVTTLMGRVKEQSESSVLSLIAPWGAGKSTLLNMIRMELAASDHGWLFAEFNPWSYSDLESLLAGFFSEIRSVLPDDEKWSVAREKIGAFAQAISPIGKMASLIGADGSSVVEAVGRWVAGDTSAVAIKRKAEEALRNSGRPILAVLDDLDRLAPDELLLVFKLVRQLGRLPNIYYLLCYDEQTIVDVLCRTELVGKDPHRAHEYLEKMVQIRLDIPPLREAQVEGFVQTRLDSIIQSSGVTLTPIDESRLGHAYQVYLKHRLRSPRAINRFAAQVDAFYGVLDAEVDFVDFLLISFLRALEPRLYHVLPRYRDELTLVHTGPPWSTSERPNEAHEHWRQRVAQAGIEEAHQERVLDLLGILFVPVRSAVEGTYYGATHLGDIARRRGVGHTDYFDRYFSFSISSDDIPDSVVLSAVVEISSDKPGVSVDRMMRDLERNPARIIRKLESIREIRGLPEARIVELMGSRFRELPEGHLFEARPAFECVQFCRDAFLGMPTHSVVDLIQRLFNSDDSALFVVLAVRRLQREKVRRGVSEKPESSLDIDAVQSDTVQLARRRLERVGIDSFDSIAGDLFAQLVYLWREYDNSQLTLWLRERIDAGTWSLIDFLGQFVATGEAPDGYGGLRKVSGPIELGVIEDLLGLDFVLERVEDMVDSFAGPNVEDFGEASPERSRAIVLSALKSTRASTDSAQN